MKGGHAPHGMYGTSIYSSRHGMKYRCNPKYKRYKDRGGRGITYDKKRETFAGFYEDMGPTYKEGLTLDRRDNDGNYNKENCQRLSRAKQNSNRRSNNIITHNGETKTLTERAEIKGMDRCQLSMRINKLKRPTDLALTAPKNYVRPRNKRWISTKNDKPSETSFGSHNGE